MTHSTFLTPCAEIPTAEHKDLYHRTVRGELDRMEMDLFGGSRQAAQAPGMSPDEACTGCLVIASSQGRAGPQTVVVSGGGAL